MNQRKSTAPHHEPLPPDIGLAVSKATMARRALETQLGTTAGRSRVGAEFLTAVDRLDQDAQRALHRWRRGSAGATAAVVIAAYERLAQLYAQHAPGSAVPPLPHGKPWGMSAMCPQGNAIFCSQNEGQRERREVRPEKRKQFCRQSCTEAV